MADRDLNIFVRAKDFFSRTFKQLSRSIRDVKAPTDELTRSQAAVERAVRSQMEASQDASRAARAFGDSMRSLGKGIDETKKRSGGLVQFLKDRFVITLGDVVRGIRTVVQGFTELNRRAVEVQGVSVQFERLSEAAGERAPEAIAKLRAATQGAISDFELMSAANKATLLGLGLSTDQMAKLADGAVLLGRAMGLSATKALNDLIVGLGRQSKLILDNLGLTIDTAAAYREYARSLKRTVESLTDVEKQTAFVSAGIRAVEEGVTNLERIGARPFERISASLTNLRDTTATTIVQSEDLNESLSRLADILQDPRTAQGLAVLVGGLADIAGAAALIVASGLTGRMQDIRDAAGEAAPNIRGLESAVKDLGDQNKRASDDSAGLLDRLQALAVLTREGFLTSVQNPTKVFDLLFGTKEERESAILDLILSQRESQKAIDIIFRGRDTVLGQAQDLQAAIERLQGSTGEFSGVADETGRALRDGLASSLDVTGRSASDLVFGLSDITRASQEAVDAGLASGQAHSKAAAAVEGEARAQETLSEAIRRVLEARGIEIEQTESLVERLSKIQEAFGIQIEGLDDLAREEIAAKLREQLDVLEEINVATQGRVVDATDLAEAERAIADVLSGQTIPNTKAAADETKRLTEASKESTSAAQAQASALAAAAQRLGLSADTLARLNREAGVEKLIQDLALLERAFQSGDITAREFAQAQRNVAAAMRGEVIPSLDEGASAASQFAETFGRAGEEAGKRFSQGVTASVRQAVSEVNAALGSIRTSPSGLQTGRVGIQRGALASFRQVGLIDLPEGERAGAGTFRTINGIQYRVLGNRTQALPADLFRGPGFSPSLLANTNLPQLQ